MTWGSVVYLQRVYIFNILVDILLLNLSIIIYACKGSERVLICFIYDWRYSLSALGPAVLSLPILSPSFYLFYVVVA